MSPMLSPNPHRNGLEARYIHNLSFPRSLIGPRAHGTRAICQIPIGRARLPYTIPIGLWRLA